MKLSFANTIKSIVTISILAMSIVGIIHLPAEAESINKHLFIQDPMSANNFSLQQGKQSHNVAIVGFIDELDMGDMAFATSTDQQPATAIDSISSFQYADASNFFGSCEEMNFSYNPSDAGTTIAIRNLEYLLQLSVTCRE